MKLRFLASSNRVPRSVRWAVPRPLPSRRSIFPAFRSIRAFKQRFLPRLSTVLSAALFIDILLGSSNSAFYRSFFSPPLRRAPLERIGRNSRARFGSL